jgi:Zn-dependent peptidase ImmA (M78 family)
MGTDTEEVEANRFAAELLMPRLLVDESVKSKMQQKPHTRDDLVTILAHEFDVSTDAMGYRLINLGIITG